MVWRPFAPAPTVVTNVNVPALQLRPRIVELLRPSTQSSSCLYEITGTLRACAEATIASAPGCGAADVGVHVRAEGAVVARGADGVVEQRVDRRRVRLRRLVGHVRVRLVDVDRRPVEVGEAHREAAAVHEAGLRADPAGRVVVVVGVHPDPAGELDLRVRGPVRPVDAVGAARDLGRDVRVLRLERGSCVS